MAEKAPERKIEAPRKGPSDVAAERQRDLQGSVEAETTLAKKEYKVGEKGLTQEQRAKLTSAERAKYPRVEKGKKYIAIGGVDKVPFKSVVRDNLWYLEMARVGDMLLKNQDSVTFEFPAMRKDPKYKQRIMAAVRDIASGAMLGVTNDIQPDEFKKKIENGRDPSDIYGAEGAFNVILAYGRAIDLLNNVEPGASIDYRLRLSGKRYSQLLAKKQKAEKKPEDGRPKESKLDIKTMPPKEYVAQKAKETGQSEGAVFNEYMDRFLSDRNQLQKRIVTCLAKDQMYRDEASKFGGMLSRLRLANVGTKDVGYDDWARLEFVSATLLQVQAEVERAEKKSVIVKKEASELGVVSIETIEFEKQARQIISEGYLEFAKPPYPILKEQTKEELVKRIAHDIVDAINPANNLSQLYEKLIHNIIRGTLDAELRHSPEQSLPYKLSDNEKIRFIVPVLQEMAKKPDSAKRNRRI